MFVRYAVILIEKAEHCHKNLIIVPAFSGKAMCSPLYRKRYIQKNSV